jgi:hypothetical protein
LDKKREKHHLTSSITARLPDRIDPELFVKLSTLFPDEVKSEWNIATDSHDIFTDESYSRYAPRIDFAVGPFNLNYGDEQMKNRIHSLATSSPIVNRLANLNSDRRTTKNPNPRCLLAFEVESSTDSKQRMGSILNASFMGCYGVVVAKESRDLSEDRIYEALDKIRSYVEIVNSVGKTSLSLSNVIITKKSSLLGALN